ncbi:hypothetical protein FN846DRAFT_960258 [Sphaerosporella brunnea]|uniref:Uncharacterized protein n=1 Tax=Sphaerosporella brunnea TaxID=1250544 RepID=A0A5J5EQV2_9PEZI|nr:hypothetical protein FN846DRAFT_960258 [Sphaerosporella brunnea]
MHIAFLLLSLALGATAKPVIPPTGLPPLDPPAAPTEFPQGNHMVPPWPSVEPTAVPSPSPSEYFADVPLYGRPQEQRSTGAGVPAYIPHPPALRPRLRGGPNRNVNEAERKAKNGVYKRGEFVEHTQEEVEEMVGRWIRNMVSAEKGGKPEDVTELEVDDVMVKWSRMMFDEALREYI